MRALLLEWAEQRGPRSFCPSEPARALGPDWRAALPALREAAARLVEEGALRCTQRGRVVNPRTARGPVRFTGVIPPTASR